MQFSCTSCLLCFIWEHDQENNKESVRIEDSEMKGAVVDQSQGQLLPLFFSPVYFFIFILLLCLPDTASLTGRVIKAVSCCGVLRTRFDSM